MYLHNHACCHVFLGIPFRPNDDEEVRHHRASGEKATFKDPVGHTVRGFAN